MTPDQDKIHIEYSFRWQPFTPGGDRGEKKPDSRMALDNLQAAIAYGATRPDAISFRAYQPAIEVDENGNFQNGAPREYSATYFVNVEKVVNTYDLIKGLRQKINALRQTGDEPLPDCAPYSNDVIAQVKAVATPEAIESIVEGLEKQIVSFSLMPPGTRYASVDDGRLMYKMAPEDSAYDKQGQRLWPQMWPQDRHHRPRR